VPWRKWGPYLSERQWGTVREDYSEDGNAWDVTRHAVPRDRGATSRATLPGTPRPVVRSAMMDVGGFGPADPWNRARAIPAPPQMVS